MIDAAIVGLGRWGRTLVEAVQGKSGGLRFIRAVSRDPGGAPYPIPTSQILATIAAFEAIAALEAIAKAANSDGRVREV